MNSRNGLATFARTVHFLCRLLGSFRGSIVAAVQASSLSVERKAELQALIGTIDTACAAIDLIMVRWER